MLDLATMLMTKPSFSGLVTKEDKKKARPVVHRVDGAPKTIKTVTSQESYEKHKHGTCAKEGCTSKRHISSSGRCHTTLCSYHYREKNLYYLGKR